ncbi:MAG: efflux RND transporter periplasmic adaptor subunit, partial [Pseudoxanthomonas sp.]
VVTVDNSDGTLLPGLTVNAEIEVSKRDKILKVSNAALRYKPANGATANPAPPAQGAQRGGGITDDLARVVADLKVNPPQQAAFDAAVAAVRERQAARQAQAGQGGNSMFGGGRGGAPGSVAISGSGSGDIQAQIRQRMTERFQQDFAAFRSGLDDAQKRRWDSALAALLNAKRASVYRLMDGKPEAVMVRIGASDGTTTEVSGGGLKEGDLIITGERARE